MRSSACALLILSLTMGVVACSGGAPPEQPPLETRNEEPRNEEPRNEEPRNIEPPNEEQLAPAPIGPASDSPTMDYLLELRQSIGSPLSGTMLDDGEDEFAALLQQAARQHASDLQQPRPLAAGAPAAGTPVDAVAALREAARSLEQHTQQLEADLPARAGRLRELVKSMRQAASEIDELGY